MCFVAHEFTLKKKRKAGIYCFVRGRYFKYLIIISINIAVLYRLYLHFRSTLFPCVSVHPVSDTVMLQAENNCLQEPVIKLIPAGEYK